MPPPTRNFAAEPDWYPPIGGTKARKTRRRFRVQEWEDLTDEQRAYVLADCPSLMPEQHARYLRGGGSSLYKFRQDNPDATHYPKGTLDYIKETAIFYDIKITPEEKTARIRWFQRYCTIKLLLEKGCGHQGHLKCQFRACNLVIRDIIEQCPETPDTVTAYLNEVMATILPGWYETDHFIARGKTMLFSSCKSLLSLLKEHRNCDSCVSCRMQHDVKTIKCNDHIPLKDLKEKFPEEYARQMRALEENKKKPLSETMKIFRKPLKDFEAIKDTPLIKFIEPEWWHDRWEIFDLRVQSGQFQMDEAMEDDEDVDIDLDASVEEESKEVARKKVAQTERLVSALASKSNSNQEMEDEEVETRPPKIRRYKTEQPEEVEFASK